MIGRNIKSAVLIGLFSVLFTFSAIAQQQNRGEKKQRTPPTFAQLLKDMDTNEDGKLSKKEIKGPLKENFDEVDTDEDGFITEEEFKKAPKPKRRARKN